MGTMNENLLASTKTTSLAMHERRMEIHIDELNFATQKKALSVVLFLLLVHRSVGHNKYAVRSINSIGGTKHTSVRTTNEQRHQQQHTRRAQRKPNQLRIDSNQKFWFECWRAGMRTQREGKLKFIGFGAFVRCH